MVKTWMDRLRLRRSKIGRRRRVGWLSRIDGVERPALLVGLGMVLYRVWKAGDPAAAPHRSRWRVKLRGWRQRLESSLGISHPVPANEERPARAGAAAPGKRQPPPGVRAGNPPL